LFIGDSVIYVCNRKLVKRTPHFSGDPLGNLEGRFFYWGIRETDVGEYWKRSVCLWDLYERKVEGGLLYWSPERYVKFGS
jgi:hypothetical protein